MLSTLFFLLTVLMLLSTIVAVIVTLVSRRRLPSRSILVGASIWLSLYITGMLMVSFLTPQTVLSLRQEKCFDDMCFSVTSVDITANLKAKQYVSMPQGLFYIVTVQLRNAAIRAPAKPDNPLFTLVDQQGHTYAPSLLAQQSIGQAPTWNQQLQPGEIVPREIVFEVPNLLQQPGLLIAEGGWPTMLIIGDENSFFHKKTEVRLTV